MEKLDCLCTKMIAYYRGEPQQIQHFMKVHSMSAFIGRSECLSPVQQMTLEAAAYLHDIGIKPALEQYGRCDGNLQEELGPAPAREMMEACGFDEEIIERVTFLVGHHHTYTAIDGLDYQILVEADFLVNLYEGGSAAAAVKSAYEQIFRTAAGKWLCRTMFIPELCNGDSEPDCPVSSK